MPGSASPPSRRLLGLGQEGQESPDLLEDGGPHLGPNPIEKLLNLSILVEKLPCDQLFNTDPQGACESGEQSDAGTVNAALQGRDVTN